MNSELSAALKRYFNFDAFLDSQEEIVSGIVDGEDLCVVMPTGAGKSLCYQLPILMRDGYGIVVSPLISLMKDQVDALNARNIPAGCVNSAIPYSEQQRVLAGCRSGEIKILYVAPERFGAESFRRFVTEFPPSLLVVDEAHCISQWGHDFRPHYLRIGEMAETCGVGQLCAFTATATAAVRRDIRIQLRRPNMRIHVSGFKRPNLAFKVIATPNGGDKLRVLRELLVEPAPTIIYASTRKSVDEIAGEFGCLAYHAGMSDADRAAAQDEFMRRPDGVLAATNAFGMGIDRPDVRRIVHYNMPGTLEAYYQEAGRAGRDGEPAECILLFSYSDRYIQEFLIDMNNPSESLVRSTYEALRRIALHRDCDTLDITAADLAGLVPDAKNERHISGALQVLQRCGAIERPYAGGAGTLKFSGDLGALRTANQLQSTQRSRFVYRMIGAYRDDLASGVEVDYDEMAAVCGLNAAQIKRVLSALETAKIIEWTPPFAGKSIVLPNRESPLALDFELLREKRDFELERLDDVVKYVNCAGCRQKFLVEYFGEDAGDWHCGNCDFCDRSASSLRPPTAAEAEAVLIVLEAAYHFNRRFGLGTVSQVLAGGRTAALSTKNLTSSPFFGRLSDWKLNRIMRLMRTMERAGLIGVDKSGDWPLLVITAAGCQYNGKHPVMLDFPDDAPAGRRGGAGKPSASAHCDGNSRFDGTDDLFELLRRERQTMAASRGVPAYRILTNDTLRMLAKMKPRTCGESMSVPGIGPAKAGSVMPRLIEVIREWQKSQNNR
ncbi:MAG: RecQ family ATP-dependent DNA helicase [Victivallaceae bacterium]|nr:RecQ family ATP-dependent DNA helicase [Victivallaceae bacterium]